MQCQQFFAQGGPGFRIGYRLVDRKISQSTDRRAQPYNRGVENSEEENAVASIDRGSFVRENCRRNRCCFRIVDGANVLPDMLLSALGGGSLPLHLGGIEFEIVELSSGSRIYRSGHSLHWIGDLFDITPSFS
jgi:hypothetical protein